jgi:VanZ family protein
LKKFLIKNKFAAVVCLVVLILSVMPSNGLPKIAVRNIDKAVHILFYFGIVLAMFFDYFFKNQTLKIAKKDLLIFLLFPLIFGGFIEIIQGIIPYRSAEILDLISDFLGGILGLLVVWLFRGKFETFLGKIISH